MPILRRDDSGRRGRLSVLREGSHREAASRRRRRRSCAYSARGRTAHGAWATTAQLKKLKEWSKPGVILFVALPLLGALFYGPLLYVAIFGLILIVADYLLKKEQLIFLTAEQLRQRGPTDPAAPARKIVGTEPGTYRCSRYGRAVREFSKGCAYCSCSP
jgi:hypothetical protein